MVCNSYLWWSSKLNNMKKLILTLLFFLLITSPAHAFKAMTFTSDSTGEPTALAANGANCSAGQAPLGVDASGAVESCWSPVSSVGDCATGACFDGTSDGGTYQRFYDGNSNYTQVQASDTTANITTTMPNMTGTVGLAALASLVTPITIANSTTETQLTVATIPPNSMAVATTFQIKVSGIGSTAASAPTATWRVRIGTTTLNGNIAFTMGPTPAASQTNQGVSLDLIVTIRTAGASGTMIGNGIALCDWCVLKSKASIITATAVVDTTVENIIELTFQWGTADAANTLTIHNTIIKRI